MFSSTTHKLLRFVLMLLMLSIGVACDLSSSIPRDESILTQTPCSFPCWHNIIPGQSSMAEVQELIRTDPFVTSSANIDQATDGAGRIGFQWRYNGSGTRNRILTENDTVYSILIAPNVPFSLQDIVVKYGEPVAINASLATSMEGGVVDATLYLYYPQLGLRVGFPIEGGSITTTKHFSIQPSTSGEWFELFAPQNSLSDFVAEIYQLEDEDLSRLLENMSLGWPGFDSLIVINTNRSAFYDATFIATATPSS